VGLISVASATGQGSASLGGLQAVNEVAAGLVTLSTEFRLAGASPVRRLWQEAWYGLGFTPSGGPFDGLVVISWWRFMQMENETHAPGSVFAQADTLYWDVWPGGEIFLEVDW
jgi:hypothetical protein